jgi:cation diffusion facilitator family transporter
MNKEKISILSTIINIILASLKIGVGLAVRSNSILASGIDSVSDILSSFLVFLGIKLSEKPPTKKFPYGLFRAETMASLVVFLMVVVSGATIIYDAIQNLIQGQFDLQINLLSLAIVAFSSFVCAIMSYLKIKIGRRENSISLITDGKHSQIDVFSSIGVFFALLFSQYIPALDSIIALVFGLYILFSLFPTGKEIIEGILDVADPKVESEIELICKKQQLNLSEIKTRKVGGRVFVELVIALPSDIKVGKADEIVSELQSLIIEQLKDVEHIIIQIKGASERFRMSRAGKKEKFFLQGNQLYPSLNIKKRGRRTIYPYRENKQIEDFGAPNYLIEDEKKGKKVFSKVVNNPYYRIGRGHGVRFARAIEADEVVAENIGKNARRSLRVRGIKVRGRR